MATFQETARVLIVEDELIAAYDLAGMLVRMGYAVIGVVDTAPDAIQRAQQDPPDLILMDIELRDGTLGTDVAAALRDADIPIVYLTAYADSETLKTAAATAPYGYLTKPPRLEDIRTTLSMALARHRQEQQARSQVAEEKRMNELRSEFLAIAAHDLKTPLSVILTSIGLLSDFDQHMTAEKKATHHQRIRTAVHNMRNQLEELLSMKRLESGELAFNPAPVEIDTVCQSIIDDVQNATEGKCPIQFAAAPAHPSLLLDTSLVRHILANLLSNAVKYSDVGCPVELRLDLKATEVVFTVRDRGMGIPAEFQDKLFQPFQRAENVTATRGTGIGLYIVKAALDRHRGRIVVESEEGRGTIVTVSLPTQFPAS